MSNPAFVVAGAGAIGTYIGGKLALAGHPVTFLGRARFCADVAAQGLSVGEAGKPGATLPATTVSVTDDPAAAFAGAETILVAVKSRDTDAMGRLIAETAPQATVISLQNGVANAERLQGRLPGARIVPGMVPFNVVQARPGAAMRTSDGKVMVGPGGEAFIEGLTRADVSAAVAEDITAVQWGKLLMNLNNALNALSGKPLKEQLLDPSSRQRLAAMQDEALTALSAAGITPQVPLPIPASFLPKVARLPTPLFKLAAGQMLKISPEARSSMADDLAAGRQTEIDDLQGAVVALAEEVGTEARTCGEVLAAIKAREAAV